MIRGLRADYSPTVFKIDEYGGIFYINANRREYVDICIKVAE
jgi:hypothetical protein